MRRVITLLLLLLALIAVGCGDDDDDSDGGAAAPATTEEQTTTQEEPAAGGAQTLTLVADPGGALKFDKTELTAKPGKITVVMDNPSDVPHAVEIEGAGADAETKTLTNGKADVTVDLKAGEYKYICPVDGHAAAGMEGTLTVR
jgi:plastocyanin